MVIRLVVCQINYFLSYLSQRHYDDKTRQCAEFHFGGCLGNGNNFATRDECEQHCIPGMVKIYLFVI